MPETKFKVFASESENIFNDTQYNLSEERIEGSQPDTPISSKLNNSALKTASLISVALVNLLSNTTNLGLANTLAEVYDACNAGLSQLVKNNTSLVITKTEVAGVDRFAFNLNDVVIFTMENIKASYATSAGSALSANTASLATEASKAKADSELEEDILARELSGNKVSSWNPTPNNTRYPSEKLTKDSLDKKLDIVEGEEGIIFQNEEGETEILSKDISISSSSTNDGIPTSKAVYDLTKDDLNGVLVNGSEVEVLGKKSRIILSDTFYSPVTPFEITNSTPLVVSITPSEVNKFKSIEIEWGHNNSSGNPRYIAKVNFDPVDFLYQTLVIGGLISEIDAPDINYKYLLANLTYETINYTFTIAGPKIGTSLDSLVNDNMYIYSIKGCYY